MTDDDRAPAAGLALVRTPAADCAADCAAACAAACAALLLGACTLSPPNALAPSAPTAARSGAPVTPCESLLAGFAWAGTRIVSAEVVAGGSLRLPGIAQAMPEHCRVVGRINERTGPVDGKPYWIGFEMRLPSAWNGRFFYQANGGLDGFLTPAYGDILGGGPRSNGLLKGFAVLSSDAGHLLDRAAGDIGGGVFGVDPQARRDYGYNAVPVLTAMARGLVVQYYGRAPDKAYLVGTSNGGRHGMVAAARDSGRFDGVLVSAPGYRLPRAAVAQVWGAQQFARVSPTDDKTQRPALKDSFSAADLAGVAAQVLARCDALDGLADGIVSDMLACQRSFDAARDIAVCAALPAAAAAATSQAPASPSTSAQPCLSSAQKQVLARVFAGPKLRDGSAFYAPLPWDPGLRGENWRDWKLVFSVGPRDAVALAFVFSTPPASAQKVTGLGTTLLDFALGFDLDRDSGTVFARDATYTESAMDFMTPPAPQAMGSFTARGAKLIVAHGASDPVFSALDTVAWFQAFQQHHGAAADQHARLYLVPGMNHSRNGPATDQFDLVDELVQWVEQGRPPQAVVATARGPGSNLVNPEVPANWSAQRTRLLCPHPQVARYRGAGDPESATSFDCRAP